MTTPVGGALGVDLDLMRMVAAATDRGNDEIRSLLSGFIDRMAGIPPSVWGGVAAARFREAVDRWNAESTRLGHALHGIADTIRFNEHALREAAEQHSAQIAAAGGNL